MIYNQNHDFDFDFKSLHVNWFWFFKIFLVTDFTGFWNPQNHSSCPWCLTHLKICHFTSILYKVSSKLDEVCSAFVDVVDRENKRSSV